jgi:hypothetical protein
MNRKPFSVLVLGSVVAATLYAAAPAAAGTIANRQGRQQQRISQGVSSGQLTARETARLEGREAHLNREIGAMRSSNGGSLTPGERALVQRQQNSISRGIYRQKHDGQTQ